MLRKVITGIVALALLYMVYVTLTIPAIAATGPAILSVALAVLLYFVWPKRKTQVHS